MSEVTNYDSAVETIKTAILQSQYDAARSVNEKQLMLYYWIGKYISANSREGHWGTGAIDTISERLQKEMPGLRGFTARNLRYMRTFYEEWSFLENKSGVSVSENLQEKEKTILENTNSEMDYRAGIEIWKTCFPNIREKMTENFFNIGFSQHRLIVSKIKNIEERIFYIDRCAEEHYTYRELVKSIASDDFRHQGALPNNFTKTLSASGQALKAINTFKDEYLLDFINTEELGIRDAADVDEKVVENAIVNNVKNFILKFGKDFAFIRNQYHLDAFGEDQYVDLLFFNRALNCLVAVELKTGEFKTSYLGQLQGYISIIDGFEKKPHENPAIGLILCADMNKPFVDYVIQDFTSPMGVATYKTSKDMSEELRKALPDIEDLKRLLGSNGEM